MYKLEKIFKYFKKNKGKGLDQDRRKEKEWTIEGQQREKYQLGGKG